MEQSALTPTPVPPEPLPGALTTTDRGLVAGTSQREDFDGIEVNRMAETASSAVAAQATAQIQARYIVAMKRPRDWDDVRVRLLKECKRRGFADVALYSLPRGGKKIEGLTIRFAEAALRCMTNMYPEQITVFDDAEKRIVQVSVSDLESNLTYSKQITVAKTVERSKPSDDGSFFSVRKNSRGVNVYTVPASEDDLLAKEGALVSKAIRTLTERILPGDIKDEAEELVRATLRDRATKDPDGERKAIADAFAGKGVMPSDLKEYLGHSLEQTSPAQLVELRELFTAIRDGEATFRDALAAKKGKEEPEEAAAGKAKTEAIKDHLKDQAKR
jgi:hypothetical protein